MAPVRLTPPAPAPTRALEIVQDRAAARCLLHPIRLRIVEHLRTPDTAAGIARRLQLPRQKVNYHLRELEAHGLIGLVEEVSHGAGRERRMQARARAYSLGPRLLGRLAADRALEDDEAASSRILQALTRTARELAAADPEEDRATAVEVDLAVADPNALRSFIQDLQGAVDLLTERYRAADGVECRLVLTVYPVASFGASLPPPIPSPPGPEPGPGTPESG